VAVRVHRDSLKVLFMEVTPYGFQTIDNVNGVDIGAAELVAGFYQELVESFLHLKELYVCDKWEGMGETDFMMC
ncbi:hypothetical protein BGW39_000912, partial [Mortierella sp. 14UC]